MATYVDGTFIASVTGGDITTLPKDTTVGSITRIVIGVVYQAGKSITVLCSETNTWVPLTTSSSANITAQLFECLNPTTDAAHTFTLDAPDLDTYATIGVMFFSDADAAAVDQQAGNSGAVNSIQPGSTTPSGNNGALCVVCGGSGAITFSINGGFTIVGQAPEGGGNYAGMIAYLVQTTAAAVNPTVSTGGVATELAIRIADFLPAAAAGGGGALLGGLVGGGSLLGGKLV